MMRNLNLFFIFLPGLITILLFLSISDYDIQKSNIVDEKVLLVIIIASMLIMIQGSIKRSKKEDEETTEQQQSLSDIIDSQIDKNEKLKS